MLGIVLNPTSPMPLYQQLADRLTTAIRGGSYPVGARIPSEHELAERYGIGRPTVRQATELLVRKGMLARRRGAGTFVVGQPRELDAFSMAGTLASFRDHGVEVEAHLLRGVTAVRIDPQDPAQSHNPFAGRDAHFFERLSRTDQGAALLEETYLDPEIFEGLLGLDLQDRSLASLVRDHYRSEPTGGRQQFRVTTVEGRRADALQLATGSPVLQIRRHLHFPRGDSAIYSEIYCRTDRVVLSQTIGAS